MLINASLQLSNVGMCSTPLKTTSDTMAALYSKFLAITVVLIGLELNSGCFVFKFYLIIINFTCVVHREEAAHSVAGHTSCMQGMK